MCCMVAAMTDRDALPGANEAFQRAFAARDLGAMERLAAANLFAAQDSAWRMVHHQAGAVRARPPGAGPEAPGYHHWDALSARMGVAQEEDPSRIPIATTTCLPAPTTSGACSAPCCSPPDSCWWRWRAG